MNDTTLLASPAVAVALAQKPPSSRILLGAAGLFVLLVGLVAMVALDELESKTKAEIGNTLKAVLNTTHGALNIWVNNLQHYTEQFAQDPKLIALVKEQLNTQRQPSALLKTSALTKLRELYKSKDALSGLGFFIVAPDFVSIASLRDSNIGTRNLIAEQRPDLMQEFFNGKTIVVPPIESDVLLEKGNGKLTTTTSTMFVGTPLRDENNRIIAVLTIRIDPHKTFSEITRLGNAGKINETFAFDRNGKIITTTKTHFHDMESVTSNMSPLVSDHNETHVHSVRDSGVDTEGHHNYLDELVFGAWLWDKNLNIGLETEITVEKALQPYYQSRKIIGFLFAITIILALVAVFIVAFTNRKSHVKLQAARDQLESSVQERTKELLTAYAETSKIKQNLDSLISSLPDAMICVDKNGDIIRANQDAERVFGYSHAELIGMSVESLIPEGLRDRHTGMRKEYMQKELNESGLEAEVFALRKGGSRFPVGININSIELDGEFVAIANVRDISERKKMESEKEKLQGQLAQAEKIKMIGQLTGGIAHDFNNILAAIMGYTQLCQFSLQEKDFSKHAEYLSEIYQSGERASDLIKQMLSFSRGESSRQEIVIPSVILDETLKILRATIPSSIEITTQVSESKVGILINPTQFHEVIMNVIINARDALEGKGKIEVGIKNTKVSGVCTSCLKEISGEFVELYVQDNGSGIKPELLTRIFEPYFTTKASNGTGMGLSMVHGITHESQGHIFVETSPDNGCKIRLLFPKGPTLSFEPERGKEKLQLPKEVVSSERNRIMIIDDEHSLTLFLSEMLRNYGYETEAYNDSKKALKEYLENPGRYDLLITDQTMPGLTGTDIAKAVSAESPDMPIILYSGYSDQIDAESAESFGIDAYFNKPLDTNAFLKKIEELLKKDSK